MGQWRAYGFNLGQAKKYIDVVLKANVNKLILLSFKYFIFMFWYIQG